MARNVEIKVEAPHPSRLAARAAELADGPPRTLEQEDLFFHHPSGRLKLRTVEDRSRLIFYDRPDQQGPKVSRYVLTPVADRSSMIALLEAAFGRRGQVRKRRQLLMIGRTRVHLDEVEGLGSFAELEVVLDEGETAAEGEREARRLLEALGLGSAAPIAGAYIDLLEQQR